MLSIMIESLRLLFCFVVEIRLNSKSAMTDEMHRKMSIMKLQQNDSDL